MDFSNVESEPIIKNQLDFSQEDSDDNGNNLDKV